MRDVVLVRVYVFPLMSGAATDSGWLAPVSGLTEVLGALLLAATAVVVIVLRARRSRAPQS